jgi:hypothetical protein
VLKTMAKIFNQPFNSDIEFETQPLTQELV